MGETNSPFEQIKYNDEELLQENILRIRDNANVNYAERVASRIEDLIQFGYEYEPDIIPIIPTSLHSLVEFLVNNTNLVRPNLVLTPSRNIQAQAKVLIRN